MPPASGAGPSSRQPLSRQLVRAGQDQARGAPRAVVRAAADVQALDRGGQERCHGDDPELWAACHLVLEWDGVRHQQKLQLRGVEEVDRRLRKDAVDDSAHDRCRAPLLQLAGGLHECTSGVGYVVYDNAELAGHLTHEVRLRGLTRAPSLPREDGQRRTEHLRECRGTFGAADVGAHHHHVLPRQAPGFHDGLDLPRQDRQGVHVVDGVGGEALDLRGVQLQGKHAVGPGHLQEIGHQPRRDR
mmetsp:Transcript_23144/g.72846  ORF Transcript_23144/g.72846 Transcript_23144/m.72846 type:complete len:244 (-) Transcript_23144:438-1169(-)